MNKALTTLAFALGLMITPDPIDLFQKAYDSGNVEQATQVIEENPELLDTKLLYNLVSKYDNPVTKEFYKKYTQQELQRLSHQADIIDMLITKSSTEQINKNFSLDPEIGDYIINHIIIRALPPKTIETFFTKYPQLAQKQKGQSRRPLQLAIEQYFQDYMMQTSEFINHKKAIVLKIIETIPEKHLSHKDIYYLFLFINNNNSIFSDANDITKAILNKKPSILEELIGDKPVKTVIKEEASNLKYNQTSGLLREFLKLIE